MNLDKDDGAANSERSEHHVRDAVRLYKQGMQEWSERLRAESELGWSEKHINMLAYRFVLEIAWDETYGKHDPREGGAK